MSQNRNANVSSNLQSAGNRGAFAHAQQNAPTQGLTVKPTPAQARKVGFHVRHPNVPSSMVDFYAQEIRYAELEGDAQVMNTMDRLLKENEVDRRVLWDIKGSLVDHDSSLHNRYGPGVPEELATALDASGIQHKSGSWNVGHESIGLNLGTQRLGTRLDSETGRLSFYSKSTRNWVGGEADQDDAELLASVLSTETDAAATDRTLGWIALHGKFAGHLDQKTGQASFTYRNKDDQDVDFTMNQDGDMDPTGTPEAVDAMIRDCSNVKDEHRGAVIDRIKKAAGQARERMIWNPDTINQRHHLRPGIYRDPYEFHAGVQEIQNKLLAGKTRCELSLEGRFAGLSAVGEDYDAQALVDENGDTRYFIDGREVRELDSRKANQRKLRDAFIEHHKQLESLAMGRRVGLDN